MEATINKKMKVMHLRRRLAELKLDTTGLKDALVSRLIDHNSNKAKKINETNEQEDGEVDNDDGDDGENEDDKEVDVDCENDEDEEDEEVEEDEKDEAFELQTNEIIVTSLLKKVGNIGKTIVATLNANLKMMRLH